MVNSSWVRRALGTTISDRFDTLVFYFSVLRSQSTPRTTFCSSQLSYIQFQKPLTFWYPLLTQFFTCLPPRGAIASNTSQWSWFSTTQLHTAYIEENWASQASFRRFTRWKAECPLEIGSDIFLAISELCYQEVIDIDIDLDLKGLDSEEGFNNDNGFYVLSACLWFGPASDGYDIIVLVRGCSNFGARGWRVWYVHGTRLPYMLPAALYRMYWGELHTKLQRRSCKWESVTVVTWEDGTAVFWCCGVWGWALRWWGLEA